MTNRQSPFRILSQSYASQLLTREQYIKTRNQLLKVLQTNGSVSEDDLRKLTDNIGEKSNPRAEKSYSPSDWVIIALGLIAAIVLGFILYN